MSWAEAKKTQLDAVEKLAHTPDGMRAFSALPNNATSINLTFLEPEHIWLNNGTVLWTETEGVMIRYSDTDYPETPTDGTLAVDNKELGKYQTTPYAVNGLTEGTTYYFSAFPYSTEGIYGPVSHATAIPFDGERVQVTVTLPEGLESATVKCVDETDTTTESKEVTQSQNLATFFVDTGHSYHIEYSDKYGYVTPSQTSSKVAVGGVTEMYSASYSVFSTTINVTYTEGATCTCSNGDVTLTAADTTGFYAFTVGRTGTWTIQITKEGEDEPKSTTVEITSNGQTEAVEVQFVEIVPWSTGTDEQIAAMLEAHYAGQIDIHTLWEIGQEREIELTTGEKIQLALMHPTYPLADGSTAAFVVGMKDSLNNTHAMNSSSTNAGGWNACAMRSWLNSTIYNQIPESFRQNLKLMNVWTANGGSQSGTTGVYSQNYLALPAEREVFGRNSHADSSIESQLFQFDWYKTSGNRIKKINGSNDYWWGRSPNRSGTGSFCVVNSNGYVISSGANYSNGVSFFCCI